MTSEPAADSPAGTETSTAPRTARPPAGGRAGIPHPGAVRRATGADAAETAWLAALTFPLACPPEAAPSEMATHIAHHLTLAHFRDWAGSAEHTLLVYDDGTRLLGYALLVVGTPDGAEELDVVRRSSGRPAPYVELSKIYVHPDVLGSGVAVELMRAAIDAAAELGPGLPFWLGTNGINERAKAFYRKSGFEVVGTRAYVVGGLAHDDVVLLRSPS